jgi:hypothetical protein
VGLPGNGSSNGAVALSSTAVRDLTGEAGAGEVGLMLAEIRRDVHAAEGRKVRGRLMRASCMQHRAIWCASSSAIDNSIGITSPTPKRIDRFGDSPPPSNPPPPPNFPPSPHHGR